MIVVEDLVGVFVEVADTLVADFDIVDFLHMVTARTAEMTMADAAGVVLADEQGVLRFMAASRESIRNLELFQIQAEEGPCQDCFHFGARVINTDLRLATSRWPQFAPAAVEAGYRSVHAFPLRHQSGVIGALNLFSARAGRFDAKDVTIIQSLADVATIGVLQQRAIAHREVLTEQLQVALGSRVTIEQAKGSLARIRGISVDEAFTLMRDHARRNHLRLTDLAHTIVHDPSSHRRLDDAPDTPS